MRTHFIFYVRDQQASLAFYRHVFATEPMVDVPGMSEFALSDDAVLGLMPEGGIARLLEGKFSTPSGNRAELYLVVPDPAAFHKLALAAGAREISALATRGWGAEVAYSEDPDGYVLAFAREAKSGSPTGAV